MTTADYKAVEKAPRMPQLRWDEVFMLFIYNWPLLLKMLFDKRNAHLLGLSANRQHIVSLPSTKYVYNSTYFTNILWCTLDEPVRWFNQVVAYDDLVTATEVATLQFPTTRLRQVASMLSLQSDYSMITFPQEWRLYAEKKASHGQSPQQ